MLRLQWFKRRVTAKFHVILAPCLPPPVYVLGAARQIAGFAAGCNAHYYWAGKEPNTLHTYMAQCCLGWQLCSVACLKLCLQHIGLLETAPVTVCCVCVSWLQIGLVGPDGQDMPLHLKHSGSSKHKSNQKKGSSSSSSSSSSSGGNKAITSPEGVVRNTGLQGSVSTSLVLLVDSWSQSFTFTRLPDKPCVSLLRDFSAPVRLEVEGETDKTLGFLAMHDSNPFARWVLCALHSLHMHTGSHC